MATQKEIDSLQKQLATYQGNLYHELEKAALYNGEGYVPVDIKNSIDNARESIRQIEEKLRTVGVPAPGGSLAPTDARTPRTANTTPNVQTTPLQSETTVSSTAPDLPFASCFISYSHQDEAFAQRLVTQLRAASLNVWYAPDDMQGGGKLYEQIRNAIRRQDKLLIVLSKHSLDSTWVMTELRNARREERTTGERKLFPIRLVDMATLRQWECFDADEGRDLAVEIREYFIPDFSNWSDTAAFEIAFTRLLRDLRAA